ncbi:CTNA1 protein, partial [Tyrannus savana]|nr:CTNA1 protein [Tyrannus savana]
ARAAGRLRERLCALRDARDTPGLRAAFQAFSEALLPLSCLTAKRLQELGAGPARKSLAHTLQLLHRCVPLLHGAVTHPRDLSGDDAFQLTEGTIRELLSLLTEPRDSSGIFSQQVNVLLDLLSHPERLRLSQGGLSSHVEVVVLHGMLLANSCRPDLQLELVERCWVLLRLRKSICGRLEGCPGQGQGQQGLEQECHSMREELENLDRTMLRATLCQILEGFFEEKEPLRQLVEGALALAGSGCFPAGPGGILRKLQPLIAALFAQAQQMLQAADMVLARCTKSQTAREIREGVEHLRSLLGSLPSLLLERSGNSTEQLQGLCHAWAGATGSLLRCFEETVGTREFLELSVLEMAKHRERCEAALARRDPEGFSWHAARLTGWARWVVGATTRHVDRATDPILRNGLLVWVEQLANSILQLRAVPARRLQSRDAFSQAASCLMDAALRVQAGLDGSNHPDLLSPLRQRVRSTEGAKGPELSPSHSGIQTGTDEAALQGDIPSAPSSPPGPFQLAVPWAGGAHPAVMALLAASRARDAAAAGAAGSALLELSDGCVDAAREALPVARPPQLQVLGQHGDIAALTPRIISLAMETSPSQLRAPGRLIHMALRLSGRIQDTQQCLAAVAGSWNSLSQQVLGFISSGDFPRGKQVLDEAMLALAGAVQLAGDIASRACNRENPTASQVWDSFLQVQAKFSRAQLNTKVFLEKAASFGGSCGVEKAILELHGVRWAVGTCVLLQAVDRFVGRDVLFLRELSRAVRSKVGSRSLLAAVAENSLRLQEAARLSYLSCPGDPGAREILALQQEIQVLMEALLDVSNTLLVSPLPSASLSIRFELLQRDVALRARALLLHLERVNAEQLHLIHDVVGAALPGLSHQERDSSKEAFEEKASRLMADIQWVRNALRDSPEAGAQLPPWDNLLSTAEHLLLLTAHAVGSARRSLWSHRDTGHAHLDTWDPHLDTWDAHQDTGDAQLDSVVWHWSAQAHYLITQLRAAPGIGTDTLRRVTECLQRDRAFPGQGNGPAQLCPAPQPTEAAASRPLGSRAASGAAQGAGETVQ